MARSCCGSGCACRIQSPDDSITITGTGSEGFPFQLSTSGGGPEDPCAESRVVTGICASGTGADNEASGDYSTVEGRNTTASGNYSHAEGRYGTASGTASHAEGQETNATATGAHSEGYLSDATAAYAHAEGHATLASGVAAHSEGLNTIASGAQAHVEGSGSEATGDYSHAEGGSFAEGDYAHAEGDNTVASGYASHSEGFATASGYVSHAEGDIGNEAAGRGSHVEGSASQALGDWSHAEGVYANAWRRAETAHADRPVATVVQKSGVVLVPTAPDLPLNNGITHARITYANSTDVWVADLLLTNSATTYAGRAAGTVVVVDQAVSHPLGASADTFTFTPVAGQVNITFTGSMPHGYAELVEVRSDD